MRETADAPSPRAPVPGADGLTVLPAVAKGIAALPRLAGDTAATRVINADLERMDAAVRQAVRECLTDGGEYADWYRSVDAPMTGPRFLSLTVLDELYCGGPHPDNVRMAVTYDNRSGKRVNWADLMPAPFVQPLEPMTDVFGTEFSVSKSPALLAWVRERVSAVSAEDPEWWADCEDQYRYHDIGGVRFMLHIDAEHEALAVETVGLPRVVMACGTMEYMSVAELERIGAAPELIEAIRTAHRAGAWRNNLGGKR
ncbi:hypothetical protein [Brevundimonas sp.]|uniref:hypothetical protein n=1 Tax=Brevundimonas sp. TaxID=1871086 RepID=UPI002D679E77|nr:hypothetical protein [Brevundimonas sp.]HYC96478.1 hypothetical protein [Brevundimonas sp.]